ncbi:MAG: hypothetical protein FJX84_06100 [Bacteroidetes bacterium]|nr:hypothetical protein [Bacteroidota bacterium]
MIRFFVEYRLPWLIGAPLLVLILNLLNYSTGVYFIPTNINLGLFGFLNIYPTFSVLFSSFLILFNGFTISRIFNENDFFDKNIYSTGFLYIILMSFFHSFYYLNSFLIVQSLLIIVIREVLQIQRQEFVQKHIFNGAFLLGISVCIHPPTALYILAFWLAVWSIKSFETKDILLVSTGIFLPFLYVGSYYFLNDKIINIDFFGKTSDWKIVLFDMMFVIVNTLFLLMLGFVSYLSNSIKSSPRLRKMMLSLILFFIVGVALGLYDFIFFFQMERFILILIAMPFFVNYGFINRMYSLFVGILFIMALGYSFIKFFTILPHS